MADLSIDGLFTAAVSMALTQDHAMTLTFAETGMRIRFPTTRRLAEHFQVPHYYILPYFAMMEEQDLIRREERVGIHTTHTGSVKIVRIMQQDFSKESIALLGPGMFREICALADPD